MTQFPQLYNEDKDSYLGEFPGVCLVVRTLCFHCCRLSLIPGLGTELLHAATAHLGREREREEKEKKVTQLVAQNSSLENCPKTGVSVC